MNRRTGRTAAWVLLLAGAAAVGPAAPAACQPAPAAAADLPEGEVTLKRRWRSVRQAVQRAAEQAHFRWAIPATISRRAFAGSATGQPIAAKAFLQDVCRQTGLACEIMNGVLVCHVPDDAGLKARTARLKAPDAPTRLEAAWELGWLRDARAWPELARAVTDEDPAMALAAAQALRRLDGQENLDWRTIGVSWDDPEFGSMDEAALPWQMPLGLAFPDCIPRGAVERLAASPYISLREAAARLTAGLGEAGKPLAEALAADRSPVVAAAARRTLRAWVDPAKAPPPAPPKRWSSTSWADRPLTDLQSAARALQRARQAEAVWRLTGRQIAYLGTPQAIKVLVDFGQSGHELSRHAAIPLAEFGGGPEAVRWLAACAAEGDGWAIWGLAAMQDGEDLAESLRPLLERGRPRWDAPPEFTVARWGGPAAARPLLSALDRRGHWACLGLGHLGGSGAVRGLVTVLHHPEAGVAVAAAKGLGETGAYAAIQPLVANLRHPDRLRRHGAVLGLGRIGGPEAAKALRELLAVERARKDRLVRKAAAETLKEIGPLGTEAGQLVAEFEQEDARLIPIYRPRNPRLGDDFPQNTEVFIKEHEPVTYAALDGTGAVMDWANRLLVRYGGGPDEDAGNECFGFDVGSATWFPIRAANHFGGSGGELRPDPGRSRGMVYDGLNRLVWIGAGVGAGPSPGAANYGRRIGLAAYDAALDRFLLPVGTAEMPTRYTGDPAKAYAFDGEAALVVSSKSGARGIGVLNVRTRETSVLKGPTGMSALDHDPPPAFAYDPVARLVMCLHPKTNWGLVLYDARANALRSSRAAPPGGAATPCGLVYDSLNRAMILLGGLSPAGKASPSYLYDRANEAWVDLQVKGQGSLRGEPGQCVFDPEHNVVLSVNGGAYRYKAALAGTKAFYGGAAP